MKNVIIAMQKVLVVIAVLSVIAGSASSLWAMEPVLSVDKDGVLVRNGKPFRAVGINFFGAFYDTLLSGGNATYAEDFPFLVERGVPFIRFAATPFWPVDFKLYMQDRAEYFRRLDAVVKAAEDCGLGLIPSLFWHQMAICDLVGESRNAWGDPASKTREFMRNYTTEFITRYKNSPAIWAWEFGNEFNLGADLPNAAEHRPAVHTDRGTAAQRTAADDITGEQFVSALKNFALLARRLDPARPIISGNAVPRHYAWHNWRERSWTTDTRGQYGQMLERDNPDPINTLSIHIYPNPKNLYFADKVDKCEVIRESMRVARRLKKPLFVGEFGANQKQYKQQTRHEIEKILDTIVDQQVPLSAFWVWRLNWQEPTFSVTQDNDRSYILDMIKRANRAFQD